jgi:hypothetical protein
VVSVDKTTTINRPGDSFVDDTTPGTADDNITKELIPANEKELTDEKEAMVNRMEDITQFILDFL